MSHNPDGKHRGQVSDNSREQAKAIVEGMSKVL